MGNNNFKVDFIGAGAPKCGTTWLAECLREHPEIDFAKHKETNFFVTPKIDFDYSVLKDIRISSFDEYKKEFSGKKEVKGEYSVFYFYDEGAARDIKKKFPHVKIIIMLRDPVKFLYSAYKYDRGSNAVNETPNSFEEALNTEKEDKLYKLNKAKFYKYVKMYLDVFGRENVIVLFHKDVINDPKKELMEVYEFIGVNKNFVPSVLKKKVNKSRRARSDFLMKMVHWIIGLLKTLKLNKLIFDLIYRNNSIKDTYERVFKVEAEFPVVDSCTRKKIIESLRGDIVSLEKLLNKDLSYWKEDQ